MAPQPVFHDRREAGQRLGEQLEPIIAGKNSIFLGLPRGGVPVAFEAARRVHADLDIFLVRKLGVPGQEELAMGAIASGGIRVLNDALIAELRIPTSEIEQITAEQQREIERRERLYREGRPALPVANRTVVLVDDGLATGATMLAAARAVRVQNPERIIVAAPVAAQQACDQFREHVDEVVCLHTPAPFYAVGIWYEDFAQVSDQEVCNLLQQAAQERTQR